MSEKFKQYKRKLRSRASIRRMAHFDRPRPDVPQQFDPDLPAVSQNDAEQAYRACSDWLRPQVEQVLMTRFEYPNYYTAITTNPQDVISAINIARMMNT